VHGSSGVCSVEQEHMAALMGSGGVDSLVLVVRDKAVAER